MAHLFSVGIYVLSMRRDCFKRQQQPSQKSHQLTNRRKSINLQPPHKAFTVRSFSTFDQCNSLEKAFENKLNKFLVVGCVKVIRTGWLVGWLQCVLSAPTLHKKAIQVVIIADKQFCVDEKNINRKRWQIKSRINPQEKKRKITILANFFSIYS